MLLFEFIWNFLKYLSGDSIHGLFHPKCFKLRKILSNEKQGHKNKISRKITPRCFYLPHLTYKQQEQQLICQEIVCWQEDLF